MSKMTPQEIAKFVSEARERAEASARKWHSDPKVKRAAHQAAQSVVSKIRDREK